MSCTIGNTIDTTIRMGLRRNRRSSRSIMAHVRPIFQPFLAPPVRASRLPPIMSSPDHEGAVLRRRLLEFVAQSPPRVVNEHVVQRRALNRERAHGDAR